MRRRSIVLALADSGTPSAHSAEHLAFSLITAAHELLRARPPRPEEQRNR